MSTLFFVTRISRVHFFTSQLLSLSLGFCRAGCSGPNGLPLLLWTNPAAFLFLKPSALIPVNLIQDGKTQVSRIPTSPLWSFAFLKACHIAIATFITLLRDPQVYSQAPL